MNSIEGLRAQVEELYRGHKKIKNNRALCKKAVASEVLTTNAIPLIKIEVPETNEVRGQARCPRD